MNFYSPPDFKNNWFFRADAMPREYIGQIIEPLNLNQNHHLQKAFSILGFASDAGVSKNFGRVGASAGPNSIRQALSTLPYHGDFKLYDAGNIQNFNVNELESAQLQLANVVTKLLSLNQFPIILGGGHETAFGHFQGLFNFFNKDIAILNFDAHFDLRAIDDAKYPSTSGTPFRQIQEFLVSQNQAFNYYCVGIQTHSNTKSLFDFAKHHKVHYLLAQDIHQKPNDFDFITKVINQHQLIYVTICLDVFAAHLAPGVSAPQVLGILPNYVLNALNILKQSGKVIALDIVELNPKFDIDNHTAKLAAQLLINFLQF